MPKNLHVHTRAGEPAERSRRLILQRGFTLIELLVVIAIVAILASIAVPSFTGLIANANVSRAVNSFISDSRFARGEAMRRGKNVVMCRSANAMAAIPVCSLNDGLAVGGWMEGWVVFVDQTGNNVFNNGTDIVLRVQEPVPGIGAFLSPSRRIFYDGSGRAAGQQDRWLVQAAGALMQDATTARTLCMNSVGRVRATNGEVPCAA